MGAICAWLRQGEMVAERLSSPQYHKARFEKAVGEIRKLTVLAPEVFVPQMRQLCQDAGVVLVLVPSVPRARTSGVARWLNPHRALIQLSLYGKMNDKFRFTFFHEAAHILLHDNQKKDIFLDDFGSGETLVSQQEMEANQWTREFLISDQYDAELPGLKSKDAVVSFVHKLGIHPAIVVGRLQRDGIIENGWMNGLKQSFDVEKVTLQPESGEDLDLAMDYVLNKNQDLYERLS